MSSHRAAQEIRDTLELAGYTGGFVDCLNHGTAINCSECRESGAHTFGVTVAGDRFAVTVTPWSDRRSDG